MNMKSQRTVTIRERDALEPFSATVAQGEEPRHDGCLSAERHWRWRGVDPTCVGAEVLTDGIAHKEKALHA